MGLGPHQVADEVKYGISHICPIHLFRSMKEFPVKTFAKLSLLALGLVAAVAFAHPVRTPTPKHSAGEIWDRPTGEKSVSVIPAAMPSAWPIVAPIVPSTEAVPAPSATKVFRRVHWHWHTNYASAKAEADADGKPLFIEITMANCVPCKQLDQTLADPQVENKLGAFVAVKIANTDPDARAYTVPSFPATVVYGADSKLRKVRVGASDAATVEADLATAFAPAAPPIVAGSSAAGPACSSVNGSCSTCSVCSSGQCASGNCCSICKGSCGGSVGRIFRHHR